MSRCAVEGNAMNANVAGGDFVRLGRQLALHGSGATTLSVWNAVNITSGARFGVRASLAGTFIAVDEFNLGVDFDRDMDVRDGSLPVWNTAAARN